MKFKLPRQVLNPAISLIISREMRKQKIKISRLRREELKELAKVSKTIEKEEIPTYLVCKKLGEGLGRGIFLHPEAEPMEKGQIIASYAGDISLIPQNRPDDGAYAFTPLMDIRLSREEQRLFDKKSPYRPRRLYSLKVDALKRGNFTRFINHSEKPNVIAHVLAVPPNPYGLTPASIEVVYIAKKNIQPGEQLLVCYEDGEKSYWSVYKIKPVPITPKTYQLSPSLKIRHPD